LVGEFRRLCLLVYSLEISTAEESICDEEDYIKYEQGEYFRIHDVSVYHVGCIAVEQEWAAVI